MRFGIRSVMLRGDGQHVCMDWTVCVTLQTILLLYGIHVCTGPLVKICIDTRLGA